MVALLPRLALGQAPRLRRSLGREWQHWRRHAPRRLSAAQVTLLLLALASGAGLLAAYTERLREAARLRGDTESGLLELRINGHKVVAADWGHWDPIHRYLQRPDRRIIERELLTSSIVRDGQHLRLIRLDGRTLYDSREDRPGLPLSPGERAAAEPCLQEQARRLTRLPLPLRLRTWGFHCPLGSGTLLGAATSISNSGATRPVNGWILHFSTIERPSYNPAINRAFALLPAKLHRPASGAGGARHAWQTLHSRPLPFLEELHQAPGNRHDSSLAGAARPAAVVELAQVLPLSELPRGLLVQVLLPWLLLLGGLSLLPASWLLLLRSLRRNQRLERRRLLRRLRQSREMDPASGLISLEEWLERLEQPAAAQAPPGLWRLGLLDIRVGSHSEALPNAASARRGALKRLLQELRRPEAPFQDRLLALSREQQLLIAYRPAGPQHAEEAGLHRLLNSVERDLAGRMQLRLRALITSVDHPAQRRTAGESGLEGLLADLELLRSLAVEDRPVRFLSAEDLQQVAGLRHRIASDFDCERLAANLVDHRYRPETVFQLPVNPPSAAGERTKPALLSPRSRRRPGSAEDGARPLYTELLFRLPEGMGRGLSIQELILALERNGSVHLIDALMLRKAISLTREVEGPRPLLATNLSATTLESLQHRSTILGLLREAGPEVCAHLALEVTETSVIADLDAWHGFLQELRGLGVKVVIDDFGSGYASLAYLFRFQADAIKIDRQFSQRLHDPDVEAMVEFLLRYERQHGTAIVMEGIETEVQLHHWRSLGLRCFQGFLFTPEAIEATEAMAAGPASTAAEGRPAERGTSASPASAGQSWGDQASAESRSATAIRMV